MKTRMAILLFLFAPLVLSQDTAPPGKPAHVVKTVVAERGTLRRSEQTLTLDGGVSVYSDDGYEFRTERAEIDLRARTARGDAPVEGQGPLGVLSAGGFYLGDTIRFEGRVRLVAYPKAGV